MSCKCGTGFGNTGLPNCLESLKDVSGLFVVQTYTNANLRNKVDANIEFTQILLDAKLNHADPSQRWYPLIDLQNIGGERAETTYKTSANGSKQFVKEGVREFTAEVWTGGATLQKSLKKGRCMDVSVYQIDADGKLVGMDKGDGFLYPIRVQKSTFDVKSVVSNGSEAGFLMLSFQWNQTEFDENLTYIEPTANVLEAKGLIDIYSVNSGISTTGFSFTLKDSYGALTKGTPLEGIVKADCVLYNTTTNLSVVLTSATLVETSSGNYTLSGYTAQTIGNKLRLTITKAGFDFANVTANLVSVA